MDILLAIFDTFGRIDMHQLMHQRHLHKGGFNGFQVVAVSWMRSMKTVGNASIKMVPTDMAAIALSGCLATLYRLSGGGLLLLVHLFIRCFGNSTSCCWFDDVSYRFFIGY